MSKKRSKVQKRCRVCHRKTISMSNLEVLMVTMKGRGWRVEDDGRFLCPGCLPRGSER